MPLLANSYTAWSLSPTEQFLYFVDIFDSLDRFHAWIDRTLLLSDYTFDVTGDLFP